MAEAQKQDNVVTNPFQLVFLSNRKYRKEGGKPEKNDYDYEGMQEGLYDVVENATMFPLDLMMGGIIDELDDALELGEPSGRFKLNLSGMTSMLSNPNKFMKGTMRKNRTKRMWANVGGFVSNSMDGALFSLMAHKLGLPYQEARAIGEIFSNSMDNHNLRIASQILIDKAELLRGNSKELAADLLSEEYKIPKDVVDNALEKATEEYEGEERKQYLRDTFSKHSADEDLIENVAKVMTDDNPMEVERAARNIAYHKLSSAASKDPSKNKYIKGYIAGLQKDSGETPGTRWAKRVKTIQFVKEGIVDGQFSSNLLNGNFDRLGVMEPTKIKLIDDKGETGEHVTLMLPKDTLLGSTLGKLYYLHPKNFIKHFLLNGDGWLLLAKKKDTINKKSFGYLANQVIEVVSPIHGLRRIRDSAQKFLNKAFVKFKGMFKLDLLSEGLKKLLGKILPAAIPGFGAVVNMIMMWFDDQIAQFFMQIVAVVLYGIIGLFIIFFILISPDDVGGGIDSPLSADLSTDNLGITRVVDSTTVNTNPFEIDIENSGLNIGDVSDEDSGPFDPNSIDFENPSLGIGDVSERGSVWSWDSILNWDGETSPLSNAFSVLPGDAEIINPLEIDPSSYISTRFGDVAESEDLEAVNDEGVADDLIDILNIPNSRYTTFSDSNFYYQGDGWEMWEVQLITTNTLEQEEAYWLSYFSRRGIVPQLDEIEEEVLITTDDMSIYIQEDETSGEIKVAIGYKR